MGFVGNEQRFVILKTMNCHRLFYQEEEETFGTCFRKDSTADGFCQPKGQVFIKINQQQ